MKLEKIVLLLINNYMPEEKNTFYKDWKDIGYKQYQINSSGMIRSVDKVLKNGKNSTMLRKGRILKTYPTNSGYLMASLSASHKSFYIHRLVVENFIRKIKPGEEVNHKDGNKLNNKLSNLEIMTISENKIHSYKILGQKPHNLKLTKQKADVIRKKYASGNFLQKELAKLYNVSPMVISRIINNIQYEYRSTN